MTIVDLQEPSPQDADGWETPSERARGRLVGVVAALGLAVLVALGSRGAAVTAGSERGGVEIVRSSVPLSAPAGPVDPGRRSRAAVTVPVAWGRASGAPVGAVADAPAVAVGDEVLVLGSRSGRVALARIEPAAVLGTAGGQAWDLVDDVPLAARSGPLLAASDEAGLVVWGGRAGVHGRGEALDDGAVRPPGSDAWTALPDLPVDLGPVRAAAMTDEGLLVVLGVPEGGGAAPRAWSWTPGAARWTELPAPPIEQLTAASALGVGHRAFVTGQQRPDSGMRRDVVTLSYDPRASDLGAGDLGAGDPGAGAWTDHALVPLREPHEAVLLPVDDASVLMWGRPSTNDLKSASPDGIVLDLESGSWRQMPRAPLATDGGAPTVAVRPEDLSGVWTGQELVVAGGGLVTPLLYDPRAGSWAALPPPPGVGRGAMAFSGGRLVWWGRSDAGSAPVLLVLPDGLRAAPRSSDEQAPSRGVSADAPGG